MNDSKDATLEMLSFKEVMRHVWNSAFLANLGEPSIDDVADFQDIAQRLFIALVVRKNGLHVGFNAYANACRDIVVIPEKNITEIPVLRNRDIERRGAWQQETAISLAEFGTPRFVEFFNWNGFSFADFPYVRCRSDTQECQYLVLQTHCRFAVLADPQT